MRLHEADYGLELVRLVHAAGDDAAARRAVEEIGYARRSPEVAALGREMG
jgi:hypothetical protein